jgi:hypothetical protein
MRRAILAIHRPLQFAFEMRAEGAESVMKPDSPAVKYTAQRTISPARPVDRWEREGDAGSNPTQKAEAKILDRLILALRRRSCLLSPLVVSGERPLPKFGFAFKGSGNNPKLSDGESGAEGSGHRPGTPYRSGGAEGVVVAFRTDSGNEPKNIG